MVAFKFHCWKSKTSKWQLAFRLHSSKRRTECGTFYNVKVLHRFFSQKPILTYLNTNSLSLEWFNIVSWFTNSNYIVNIASFQFLCGHKEICTQNFNFQSRCELHTMKFRKRREIWITQTSTSMYVLMFAFVGLSIIINRIFLYSITAGTLGVLRRDEAIPPPAFVSDGVFIFKNSVQNFYQKYTKLRSLFTVFKLCFTAIFTCSFSPFVLTTKRAICFRNHSCWAWQNSPLSFKKYSINFWNLPRKPKS